MRYKHTHTHIHRDCNFIDGVSILSVRRKKELENVCEKIRKNIGPRKDAYILTSLSKFSILLPPLAVISLRS